MLTVLAGGVGAARFLAGLVQEVEPSEITTVVNTGDDFRLHGLAICPDLDTVTYTLAGAVNPETGWGLAGESWRAMEALDRYGGQTWFSLGDTDLATHMYRTQRLQEGAGLTQVTSEIAGAWNLEIRLLPMSDDPVATMLGVVGEGEIPFQEYFVARRHAVAVKSVRFEGAERAAPAPGVLSALEQADRIIVAPSNPVVSIGPILAVPGVREVLERRRERVVAISPIVGGVALKGPADRMLTELGHESTAAGVAHLYRSFASTFVIDDADADSASEVADADVVVTDTVMTDRAAAAALARAVLAR